MDSGTDMRTPFAFFDPDTSSWRTSEPSLFEDSTSSSVIWPRSGMTAGGRAYALPTPVPHIDVSGCSSLLPTPVPHIDVSGCSSLLPTPVANDSGNTPEDHLRKKPGREVVTSLAIMVENDLIKSGGRIGPPSPDGSPSSDAPHQPPPTTAAD